MGESNKTKLEFFENLDFYFMKTANIPVYGKIAVYGNIAMFVYKINITLRCLEYICSVSSPLRHHGPLNRQDTDKCTLTIIYTTSIERPRKQTKHNTEPTKPCSTLTSFNQDMVGRIRKNPALSSRTIFQSIGCFLI